MSSHSSHLSPSTPPTPSRRSDTVMKSINNYCAIVHDSLVIDEKCKEEQKKIRESARQLRDQLTTFLEQSKQTCVPVKLTIDGAAQELFLRLRDKQSQKTLNEDNFQSVLQQPPSEQDLLQVWKQMKDPNASVADVLTQWLIDRLYEENTTHKTVFELTSTCERGFGSKASKNGKGSKRKRGQDMMSLPPSPDETHYSVPDHIVECAAQLYTLQHNSERLKDYKRDKIKQLNVEKKSHEPVLEEYLAKKPIDRQSQKITMTVQNEVRPFYLRRLIKTRKPTLSLVKSKPLIHDSVHIVIQQANPQLLHQPFTPDVYQHLRHQQPHFFNSLFADFCKRLEKFKQSGARVSTSIVLEAERSTPHHPHHSHQSHHHNDGDESGDDDDGDDGDH